MRPESVEPWLQVFRQFSLAIIGVVGLMISLLHYWQTNDVSLPAFAAFAGLLGLNALNLGRG